MKRRKRKEAVTAAVRRAVLESGRSLTDVARATGIDLGNLSRFVRGERGLSMENFDALCEHLGLRLTNES